MALQIEIKFDGVRDLGVDDGSRWHVAAPVFIARVRGLHAEVVALLQTINLNVNKTRPSSRPFRRSSKSRCNEYTIQKALEKYAR